MLGMTQGKYCLIERSGDANGLVVDLQLLILAYLRIATPSNRAFAARVERLVTHRSKQS